MARSNIHYKRTKRKRKPDHPVEDPMFPYRGLGICVCNAGINERPAACKRKWLESITGLLMICLAATSSIALVSFFYHSKPVQKPKTETIVYIYVHHCNSGVAPSDHTRPVLRTEIQMKEWTFWVALSDSWSSWRSRRRRSYWSIRTTHGLCGLIRKPRRIRQNIRCRAEMSQRIHDNWNVWNGKNSSTSKYIIFLKKRHTRP